MKVEFVREEKDGFQLSIVDEVLQSETVITIRKCNGIVAGSISTMYEDENVVYRDFIEGEDNVIYLKPVAQTTLSKMMEEELAAYSN